MNSTRRARPLALLLLLLLAACQPEAEAPPANPPAAAAASGAEPERTDLPPLPTPSGENEIGARVYEYRIDLTRDTVPAGTFTFHVINAGTTTHMLIVRNDDTYAATNHLPPGETATLEVTLEPGVYHVVCAVRDEFDHISEGERREFYVL